MRTRPAVLLRSARGCQSGESMHRWLESARCHDRTEVAVPHRCLRLLEIGARAVWRISCAHMPSVDRVGAHRMLCSVQLYAHAGSACFSASVT